MTLLYGVDTLNTGSTSQYVTAANVSNWNNVMSARVTLNFVNPLYSVTQPGQHFYTAAVNVENADSS